MPEVELDSTGVTTIICELETAGVAQPVGSSRCYLGPLPEPDHELVKSVWGEWMASFRHEDVAARGFLVGLELSEPA